MATDIERLQLRMEANMTQVERALTKLNRDANASSRHVANRYRDAGRRVEASFQRIQRAAMSVGAAVGVAFSVRAFGDLIRDSLQAAETLQDTATRVAFTVEQLQELRFAADQNGSSARTLDMALQRFSRRTGEAAQGTGELSATIQQLGIQLRNSDGTMRSSYDILLDYADAIQNAESDQERLRLAFKAFDSEGAQLVNLMRQGRDGVQEFGQAAREAGLVLEEGMVNQGAEANARLREMSQILTTQLQGAVLERTSELMAMAEALGDIAAAALEAGAALSRAFGLGAGVAGSSPGEAAAMLQSRANEMSAGRVSMSRADGRDMISATLRVSLGNERAEAERRLISQIVSGMQAGLARGVDYGRTIDEAVAERLRFVARELSRSGTLENMGIPFAPVSVPDSGSGNGGGGGGGGGGAGSTAIRPAPAFPPEAEFDEFAWVETAQAAQEQLDGMAAKADEMAKGVSVANDAIGQFNLTLETTIASGIKDLEQAFVDFVTTGEAGFDDFARSVLANLARMAFQQSIGNPLERALGSVFGFGGGKSGGGAVRPGMAYQVGEHGSEKFVPTVPGMIVPNTDRAMSAARSAPQEIKVRLMVTEGEMFASRVEAISTDVTRQHIPVSVEISRGAVAGDLAQSQKRRLG